MDGAAITGTFLGQRNVLGLAGVGGRMLLETGLAMKQTLGAQEESANM